MNPISSIVAVNAVLLVLMVAALIEGVMIDGLSEQERQIIECRRLDSGKKITLCISKAKRGDI